LPPSCVSVWQLEHDWLKVAVARGLRVRVDTPCAASCPLPARSAAPPGHGRHQHCRQGLQHGLPQSLTILIWFNLTGSVP
jgi:hypothetical protein